MEQSVRKKRSGSVELSLFAPFVKNPLVTSTSCPSCGGHTTVRPTGTTYCCKKTQIAAFDGLVKQLESSITEELKDPAIDDHQRTSLSHMLRTVRSARSV